LSAVAKTNVTNVKYEEGSRGRSKGTIEGVKANLRKGMTLTAACDTAGYGRGRLQHFRRQNKRLDTDIKKLLKGQRRKPKPHQHVHITGRNVKPTEGSIEFWERWNKTAKAGKLRKTFGAKIIKGRKVAPYT
jgi:hypothetical protein